MNKIILLIFLLFAFSVNLLAQTYLNVQLVNGTLFTIPKTYIDSINYTNVGNICPATLSDIDGNIYNTVAIGSQCWMKENLKTMHYKNGVVLPSSLSDSQWQFTSNGACADYNNDSANSSIYGKLYNWYAVADPSGLCPVGWHVPENWELNVLVKYIDPNSDTTCIGCTQSIIAGGLMKEAGTAHWTSPNTGVTNSSGFTALPGGYRGIYGTYSSFGTRGYWWSKTQSSTSAAYYCFLNYANNDLGSYYFNKPNGFSVRCVKD